MAHRAADAAVQVWGGHGFCKPSVVERLYRDQRILEIYEGTPKSSASSSPAPCARRRKATVTAESSRRANSLLSSSAMADDPAIPSVRISPVPIRHHAGYWLSAFGMTFD